jgi:hypothetical protein
VGWAAQSSDNFPRASIGPRETFDGAILAPIGAPATLGTPFAKSLESIESRKTHAFAAGKNPVFSNSDLPALQIFANLFLAESRKINGLKAKKFGFSESRSNG